MARVISGRQSETDVRESENCPVRRCVLRQYSERGVTVAKRNIPKKPMTKRRLKNLILNVLKNPFNMVVLVSLVVLFCLYYYSAR